MDQFDEQLQAFLDYLAIERRYAVNTITAYRQDLLQLKEFLQKDGGTADLKQLDYHHARYFLVFLQNKGLSKSSIARKVAALKTFCRFLQQDEVIEDNSVALLSTPKKPKRLPKVATETTLSDFFDELSKGEDPTSLRDQAIFELLYSSGLRVSELAALNVSDFSVEGRILRIVGKGKKERLVPMGRKAIAAIEKYLQQGRAFFLKDPDNQALFLNHRGGRLTIRGIEYLLESYIKKGALHFQMTPHVFRHSFATHLLDNGMDIRIIQELLGHESLSTTQIYTEVSKAKIQHVYFKAHPRA